MACNDMSMQASILICAYNLIKQRRVCCDADTGAGVMQPCMYRHHKKKVYIYTWTRYGRATGGPAVHGRPWLYPKVFFLCVGER